MLILLCRAVARLAGFLLMAVLALAGLAVAVFSIGGGEATLSYATLAELIRLPELRDATSELLRAAEAPGAIATGPLLGGLGAVAAGLILLVGTLAPRRERLVRLEENADGDLLARRRALAGAAATLVGQTRDLSAAKVRARPRRRGTGGRLRVRARRTATATRREITQRARASLEPLSDPYRLRVRLSTRLAAQRERVR